MHSLNLFLASLLFTLFAVYLQAEGKPIKRNGPLISLPLKRHHQPRNDIHPLVLHQLHLNRGNKRLARMTGREAPSADDLAAHLRRAVEASVTKRFNRPGVPTSEKRFDRAGIPGSKRSTLEARAPQATGQADPASELDAISAFLEGLGATGVETDPNTGVIKLAPNGTVPAPTATSTGSAVAVAAPTGKIGGGAAIAAVNNQQLVPAITPTAPNSLGLHVEINDVGYSATVQIGTPPRDFLILMDSGSADFWVGGETCQSDTGGGCGNHQFLGPQSSSSFLDSNVPWNITYGTGAVSGNIVKDNVLLAGFKLDGLVFGTALTESVDFSSQQAPFDGLMGLARSDISNQGTPTAPEILKSQGLVAEAITSYKISRLSDNLNDGEITFGGLDATKFDAKTLVTVPNVSQQGFWEAKMPSITVNGIDIGLKGRSAIIDTGTTLIIAPPLDAEAIHQAIPGAKSSEQGFFTVPCNLNASVAFTFGTTSFEIDARDLAFAPLDPGAQDCVSGISAGNFGGPTEWLVGDVFLKNAYFSHNVDKNTISLAKLV
jgi:hypothetical protein